MRVALVSEHASPLAALGGADAGGQNVHVAALAEGLADLGHEVVVYTRRESPDQPDRIRTEAGYHVEHVRAGPATVLPKDAIAEHLDELAAGLAASWREDPVDLVHAHFWMSGVASTRAARLLAQPPPVLQTFHALGVVKKRHQGAADTSPSERIGLERRLLAETDHVVATCTDEVRELRRLGLRPGRASVIPCGVDPQRFRPGVESDLVPKRGRPHRLLAVGRLVPRKGMATVIEALADVPDTELLVVGGPEPDRLWEDEEACRLERVARSAGVRDRVRFLGGVPPSAMPALYGSSDVAATAAWYEPFGITPVEAMACGIPVVATDVGGHRDTVVPERTGELVPPREPRRLASTVRRLLADPTRRTAYGETGRRRALELYDWTAIVGRVELVYRAVSATMPRTQEVSS